MKKGNRGQAFYFSIALLGIIVAMLIAMPQFAHRAKIFYEEQIYGLFNMLYKEVEDEFRKSGLPQLGVYMQDLKVYPGENQIWMRVINNGGEPNKGNITVTIKLIKIKKGERNVGEEAGEGRTSLNLTLDRGEKSDFIKVPISGKLELQQLYKAYITLEWYTQDGKQYAETEISYLIGFVGPLIKDEKINGTTDVWTVCGLYGDKLFITANITSPGGEIIDANAYIYPAGKSYKSGEKIPLCDMGPLYYFPDTGEWCGDNVAGDDIFSRLWRVTSTASGDYYVGFDATDEGGGYTLIEHVLDIEVDCSPPSLKPCGPCGDNELVYKQGKCVVYTIYVNACVNPEETGYTRQVWCRWNESDIDYDSMTDDLDNTPQPDDVNQYEAMNDTIMTSPPPPIGDGWHFVFVRCKDSYGNKNTEGLNLTFEAKIPPEEPRNFTIYDSPCDTDGVLNLTWLSSPPAEDNDRATSYIVYRGTNRYNLKVDTSLMLNVTVTGATGNEYTYRIFNNESNYTIQNGDRLHFDIYIDPGSPEIRGGFDGLIDGVTIRDNSNWVDQNGLSIHPATDLSAYANGTWYHRVFDISANASSNISDFKIAHEGDSNGNYLILLDNVVITDSNGTLKYVIYRNGTPPDDYQAEGPTGGISQQSLGITREIGNVTYKYDMPAEVYYSPDYSGGGYFCYAVAAIDDYGVVGNTSNVSCTRVNTDYPVFYSITTLDKVCILEDC